MLLLARAVLMKWPCILNMVFKQKHIKKVMYSQVTKMLGPEARRNLDS